LERNLWRIFAKFATACLLELPRLPVKIVVCETKSIAPPAKAMKTPPSTDTLRQQAERIVQHGRDVRAEISRLASRTAEQYHRTRDGLVGLSRAVVEGALDGARQATPAQSESVLREVVAGLADGLAISAQAVKLTLDESRSRGTQFAREDLDKIAGDFREVGETFAQTVRDTAGKVGGELAAQLRGLAKHAGRALEQARPAFESAVKAAREDPAALGRETLRAGAGAAREAAGILFSELGKRLEQAGQQLRRPKE
jgi:hypothetical protein